jgi:hypothetical protein
MADDEVVRYASTTVDAAARLMVTRPDLYEDCSSGAEIVARIQELEDRGLLEPTVQEQRRA